MKLTRKLGFFASGGVAVVSLLLAACSSSNQIPTIQSLPSAPSATRLTVHDPLTNWKASLQKVAMPRAGCFKAQYPSLKWTSVACVRAPHLLYPLPRGIRPNVSTVGDGNDFTIQTGSNKISKAIGSFPSVSGVTSVKSTPNPQFGDDCDCGPNSYTLQLNASFFATKACDGEANCAGWEQFVYENPPGKSDGELFIQDWLIPANLTGSITCPRGKGWESADGGCVQNSPSAVAIPNQSIANLADLIEEGQAASGGDSIFLTVGSTVFGMKNIESNGITDLSKHWTGAEFNVVGNAGGSIAEFNSGSTITINEEANDGLTSAPTCEADSGTTGESSNLFFTAAPPSPPEQQFPSIEVTESTTAGTASCDALNAT